ncbi:pseudouridine synthase [Silanimonas algicola]
MLLAFHKPMNVLCQFTDRSALPRPTLAGYGLPKGVYAAGRLDFDSEGLLLLTDDGPLVAAIGSPKFDWPKTYLVQVEGTPAGPALQRLRDGLVLNDGPTKPAEVTVIEAPAWLPPRDPPVRVRQTVPDAWLRLVIREGRNRQVRRMTAAVGLPTLRLVREAIGPYTLDGLPAGQWREVQAPALPARLRRSGAPRAATHSARPASTGQGPSVPPSRHDAAARPGLIRPWRRDGR